jgi:hypothetical protein
MARPLTAERILRSAFYGFVVGAAGAIGLQVLKTPAPRPIPVNPMLRAATVVTPTGDGNCRRLVYSNDTAKVLGAAIVNCTSIAKGEHSALPPVLQGYQASLHPR